MHASKASYARCEHLQGLMAKSCVEPQHGPDAALLETKDSVLLAVVDLSEACSMYYRYSKV